MLHYKIIMIIVRCIAIYLHTLLQKYAVLRSAAKTGNVTEVENLIQSGIYIDCTENTVS